MNADLHMHSTASDGQYAPEEVVRLAAKAGTQLLALTDHDTADGVPRAQAAAQALGVTLIPGIEMGCSCGLSREVHILGYGVDPAHEVFVRHCREKAERREARAIAMVEKLRDAGAVIRLEDVRAMARGVISRTHIARVLVDAGYANSAPAAFDKYLKPGKCGYVPRPEFSVAEAIEVIQKAGGVAVLAHPMEMKMGETMLESLVEEWKGQGLCGVEVYHPSAANNHAAFLYRLARRQGLLVTGGSDFHGEAVRKTAVGEGLDRWQTMESDVRALLAHVRYQP